MQQLRLSVHVMMKLFSGNAPTCTFRWCQGRLKKVYQILRFNPATVHLSVTKMLVIPDSRDIYKSFGS